MGGYHNLSHHGKDEAKLEKLEEIEVGQMELFGELLKDLAEVEEGDGSLLDNTMVLYGCHMGDANIHNNKNLPIILAGGGFRHGQHLAFNEQHNTPLCNIYVSMLQKMAYRSGSLREQHGDVGGVGLS